MGRTPAQRLADRGEVVLPDDCPPCVDAHAWRLLVRHVREGVPYAALAREVGVSARAVSYRVERLLARLRTPELLCLPLPLWRALTAAGYTTRAAIAAACDERLLAVPGLDAGALWRLRSGLYDAHRDRAGRRRYYQAWRRTSHQGPGPIPQERGELPPAGVLVADDDGGRVQCHVCGRFYVGLAHHIRLAHGLTAEAYRERYGLARGLSLFAAGYREQLRAAALARGQGQIGRDVLREAGRPGRRPGRPARLSSRIAVSATQRRREARRRGDAG